MTNHFEDIKWKKAKKIWSKELCKNIDLNFLRLKFIDDYNYNINNVNIADQLSQIYSFKHCLRQKKW